MKEDAGSRLDTSVPKPAGAERLSEKEKRALELQDQAEHSHGRERERATEKARDLADDGPG